MRPASLVFGALIGSTLACSLGGETPPEQRIEAVCASLRPGSTVEDLLTRADCTEMLGRGSVECLSAAETGSSDGELPMRWFDCVIAQPAPDKPLPDPLEKLVLVRAEPAHSAMPGLLGNNDLLGSEGLDGMGLIALLNDEDAFAFAPKAGRNRELVGNHSTVDVVELTVTGSLKDQVVDGTLRAKNGQLRYCYDLELKTDPATTGNLVIRFQIKPEGFVADLTVSSDITERGNLTDCVVRKVKRWKFAEAAGTSEVSVGWQFTP